jgi:hypothetical protein
MLRAVASLFQLLTFILHSHCHPRSTKHAQDSPLPFDHIFPDLAKAGHIVRVAYPPLAIQDVRHTSAIDSSRRAQNDMEYRAKIHRWGEVGEFCDPLTVKPIEL